jgi:hypothetical protein
MHFNVIPDPQHFLGSARQYQHVTFLCCSVLIYGTAFFLADPEYARQDARVKRGGCGVSPVKKAG